MPAPRLRRLRAVDHCASMPLAPPALAARGRALRERALHQLPMDATRSPGAALPLSVRPERPCERVIGEASLERVLELGLEVLVLDGSEELDPLVEVTRHQVGGADVVAALLAAVERVDPRMLEEPADDRHHVDRVADAWDAWLQAADPADVEIDRHARLRSPVQRLDALGVD